MKLYHFSSTLPATGGTVDPKKLGQNSWSTAEKRALSIPRSFFYTHPKHKEELFTKDSPLFSGEVPDEKVYDFDKDEHGIKQPGTTLSHMIAKVLRKGYHGVKYFDGKVVAMFKPVAVAPHGKKVKLARSLVYVSPSMREGSTMAQALAGFKSPEHAALNAEAVKLGGAPVPAMGTWTDGAEESSVVKVPTERAKVVAALLGKKFQQKAVGLFHPGAGTDLLHLVYMKGHTPESADTKLRSHGIEYATHVPVKNGVITHLIGAPPATVEALGHPFRTITGTAEFPGADTREEAGKVYDSMLQLARELPEPTGDIRHKNNSYRATFKSGDNEYTARLEPFGGAGSHMFDFKQHGAEKEHGITGAGNAMQTFSHVAAHFLHALRTLKPKKVYFSAEEPSRIKLYAALMKKLPKYAPEYVARPSSVKGSWAVTPKNPPTEESTTHKYDIESSGRAIPSQPDSDDEVARYVFDPEEGTARVYRHELNSNQRMTAQRLGLEHGAHTVYHVTNDNRRIQLARGDWTPLTENVPRFPRQKENPKYSRTIQVPIGRLKPTEANQDPDTVDEYAAEFDHAPETFPAIVVDRGMNIQDGHHRYKAALKSGQTHVPVRIQLARPAPFSEDTKALLPHAGDPGTRGILADHLEELGDPLHHVFRGEDKGDEYDLYHSNPIFFASLHKSGGPGIHVYRKGEDGLHPVQVSASGMGPKYTTGLPTETVKDLIRHHYGNAVKHQVPSRITGPGGVKKEIANDARGIMKLARGWDSVGQHPSEAVHPAEGWIAADGTHHANEPGDYGNRHFDTVKRLGYKNDHAAEADGLMHVAYDAGQIVGHRADKQYTGPQIHTLKKLARLHKSEPAVTSMQNGMITVRPLKLAKYKAPSGGMIVNNQYYQGGKFLPRVFQSIKRVRDAKRAAGQPQQPK